MATYKIMRYFPNASAKPVRGMRGLTLEEAQAHCKREDTHKVCWVTNSNGVKQRVVDWFDGYTEE